MKFSNAARAIALAASEHLHKSEPITLDLSDVSQLSKDFPTAGSLLKGMGADSDEFTVGLTNALVSSYINLTTEDLQWAENAAGSYPDFETLDEYQAQIEDPDSEIMTLLHDHCPPVKACLLGEPSRREVAFCIGIGAMLYFAFLNTETDIFDEEFDEANPIKENPVKDAGLDPALPESTPLSEYRDTSAAPATAPVDVGYSDYFIRRTPETTQVLLMATNYSDIKLDEVKAAMEYCEHEFGVPSRMMSLQPVNGLMCIAFPS